MIGVIELPTPSDPELWAIETGAELLAAEFALIDAESAWSAWPCPETAADYLEAMAEVVDLLDFYGRLPRMVAA